MNFWEKNAIFHKKNTFFEGFFFSNFSDEAEKLIFPKKMGSLATKNSLQSSLLIKSKYCLSILEIVKLHFSDTLKKADTGTSARLSF